MRKAGFDSRFSSHRFLKTTTLVHYPSDSAALGDNVMFHIFSTEQLLGSMHTSPTAYDKSKKHCTKKDELSQLDSHSLESE